MDDFEKLETAWLELKEEIFKTKLFTKILIPFVDWLSSKL